LAPVWSLTVVVEVVGTLGPLGVSGTSVPGPPLTLIQNERAPLGQRKHWV
jgi:hypothetical protein